MNKKMSFMFTRSMRRIIPETPKKQNSIVSDFADSKTESEQTNDIFQNHLEILKERQKRNFKVDIFGNFRKRKMKKYFFSYLYGDFNAILRINLLLCFFISYAFIVEQIVTLYMAGKISVISVDFLVIVMINSFSACFIFFLWMLFFIRLVNEYPILSETISITIITTLCVTSTIQSVLLEPNSFPILIILNSMCCFNVSKIRVFPGQIFVSFLILLSFVLTYIIVDFNKFFMSGDYFPVSFFLTLSFCLFFYCVEQFIVIKYLRLLFINVKQFGNTIKALERENARKLSILKNIIPPEFIDKVKHSQSRFVQTFKEKNVIITDLVGFTKFASSITAEKVITALNWQYSAFDHLTDEFGFEKVKTIGDSYFTISGSCKENLDEKSVLLSIRMINELRDINTHKGMSFKMRCGVAKGVCHLGVMGFSQLNFDCFGQAVFDAQQMEKSGKPNFVHVTKNIFLLTREKFDYDLNEETGNSYFVRNVKMDKIEFHRRKLNAEVRKCGKKKKRKKKKSRTRRNSLVDEKSTSLRTSITLKRNTKRKTGGLKAIGSFIGSPRRKKKRSFKSTTPVDVCDFNETSDCEGIYEELERFERCSRQSSFNSSGKASSLGSGSWDSQVPEPTKKNASILSLMHLKRIGKIRHIYKDQDSILKITFWMTTLMMIFFIGILLLLDISHWCSITMITWYIFSIISFCVFILYFFISKYYIAGIIISILEVGISLMFLFMYILLYMESNVLRNREIKYNEYLHLDIVIVICVSFVQFNLIIIPFLLKLFIIIISLLSFWIIGFILNGYFQYKSIIYFITTILIEIFAFYNVEFTLFKHLFVVRKRKKKVKKLKSENKDNENILRSSLPIVVINRLKKNGMKSGGLNQVYDSIENGNICFIEICNLKQFIKSNYIKSISLLNELFSYFDNEVQAFGCHKIKSIGTTYIFISGINKGNVNHQMKILNCALTILERINFILIAYKEKLISKNKDEELGIKIGIHNGSFNAGIVGESKFLYDIFGDSVNTAARMCELCETGKIQICSERLVRLYSRSKYYVECRGKVKAKGKGDLETFYVYPGNNSTYLH